VRRRGVIRHRLENPGRCLIWTSWRGENLLCGVDLPSHSEPRTFSCLTLTWPRLRTKDFVLPGRSSKRAARRRLLAASASRRGLDIRLRVKKDAWGDMTAALIYCTQDFPASEDRLRLITR
jgi:hypothetical protein